MSKFRDWSLGARLVTLGAVGLLLTIGLCSFGSGFEGGGTPLQNFLANAGLITFIVSIIFIGVGILVAIVSLITRAGTPRDGDKR